MLSILVWAVYGIFVGAIAKAIVPGEENFGFIKTVALGVCGSYMGGAIHYMMGMSSSLEPSGIFLGVLGSVISLIAYNNLTKK